MKIIKQAKKERKRQRQPESSPDDSDSDSDEDEEEIGPPPAKKKKSNGKVGFPNRVIPSNLLSKLSSLFYLLSRIPEIFYQSKVHLYII